MTREEQEHYERLAEHYNAKQKTDLDKNNMTREEAIKELQISHDMMRSYAIDESESRLMTALNMAVKALEQEPTGWIPCSERLPQNSGNYLITYCLQDEIETLEAVYVEEEYKWFDITDIEITLAVIAWMPLPKPYKESEVDE